MLTRLEILAEGVHKCQTATAKVVELKRHQDPAIRELASAIHFLSFGVQEIAQAISEEGRTNDLPIQRG